jgi:serine/threonine-protein kinase
VSISNSGGVQPVWSQKTNELFYRSDDRHIMVANYTVKENNFRLVGKPRVWSERQLADTGLNPSFDLAPDGKRFAVLLPAENPEPLETKGHVTMILNFFDELRRRIPDGK